MHGMKKHPSVQALFTVRMRRTALLFLMALPLLSGWPCRPSGARASPVQETVPDRRVAEPERPLTLADCIRIAWEGNELLGMNRLDVEGSRFGMEMARKEFGYHLTPSLNAVLGDSGMAGQRSSIALTRKLVTGTMFEVAARWDQNRNQVGDYYNSDVRFTVSQPLLQNFGTAVNRDALLTAERQYQYSKWNHHMEQERLALDVAATFADILREQRLLEAGRRAVETADGLMEEAGARLTAGKASRLDVFRAEQQQLRARSELSLREDTVAGLRDRLRLLMGMSPDAHFTLDGGPLPEAWENRFRSVEEAEDAALANRLDLRQMEMMVQDAGRRVRVARKSLLPGLELNLSAARRGTADDLGDAFSEADDELYVYFNTYFSTNRAAARKQVHDAVLYEKRMKLTSERMRKEIILDVRGLWRDLEMVRQSQRIAVKNLEYAEQMAELGRLRFMRGLADNSDVIRAEEELTRTSAQVAAQQAQEMVLSLRLLMVTGTFQPPGGAPEAVGGEEGARESSGTVDEAKTHSPRSDSVEALMSTVARGPALTEE